MVAYRKVIDGDCVILMKESPSQHRYRSMCREEVSRICRVSHLWYERGESHDVTDGLYLNESNITHGHDDAVERQAGDFMLPLHDFNVRDSQRALEIFLSAIKKQMTRDAHPGAWPRL